jgi:hypothetical protein
MTRSPRWPLACGERDGRPPLLACSRASMSNMRVKIPASSSSDILLAAGAETAPRSAGINGWTVCEQKEPVVRALRRGVVQRSSWPGCNRRRVGASRVALGWPCSRTARGTKAAAGAAAARVAVGGAAAARRVRVIPRSRTGLPRPLPAHAVEALRRLSMRCRPVFHSGINTSSSRESRRRRHRSSSSSPPGDADPWSETVRCGR